VIGGRREKVVPGSPASRNTGKGECRHAYVLGEESRRDGNGQTTRQGICYVPVLPPPLAAGTPRQGCGHWGLWCGLGVWGGEEEGEVSVEHQGRGRHPYNHLSRPQKQRTRVLRADERLRDVHGCGWVESSATRVDQRRGDGGRSDEVTDGLKQVLLQVPLLLVSSSLGLRPVPSKACVGCVQRVEGVREARFGQGGLLVLWSLAHTRLLLD